MKRQAFWALALLGTVVAVSCSGSSAKTGAVGSYDKSCDLDEDCTFVNVGICDCTCEKDVINVAEVAKFESDTAGCGSTCGACPPVLATPYCNAGTCDAKLPSDGGTD